MTPMPNHHRTMWGQAFSLPPGLRPARRAEARRQPGRAAPLTILALALLPLAAQQPSLGGRGQAPAGPPASPARGSASVRWEPWSAMRSSAATVLGWQVGSAADAYRQTNLFTALEKTDLLGLANLEGSSTQKVNLEIPKNVAPNLAPGEITAVKDRL